MRKHLSPTASLLARSSAAAAATADVASDHPAAILVFPKLLVDTANGLDTLIRISNVSDTAINVYCFYVNATPQCSLEDGDHRAFRTHVAASAMSAADARQRLPCRNGRRPTSSSS